ncbi:glutamyl-tRNA synthetase [Tilletiopsis washingtonensis]|uniref:Glutamate--tRNA ligase, mitochondrial n=1 Tax=Tilletiopsis washingtonensis TaxID=58919 RepID=A0A316ZG62_9BASI|nr:glutamyl-tRNA synthetase [Tilletiopsis washingtonensis]PWN99912.1 glutamyl-tRNA synthetase [Tilletiopsis washingtonensis]
MLTFGAALARRCLRQGVAGPSTGRCPGASARRCMHDSADARAGQTPRVRFAPSPTGALHLGGLRTALFNYLFARQSGGRWLLRIEDTDRSRLVEGSQESLLRVLALCGLTPDESPSAPGDCGPYVQSERLSLYAAACEQLIRDGHAYRDFQPEAATLAEKEAERKTKKKTPRPNRDAIVPDEEEAQRLIAEGRPFVVRFRVPRKPTTIQDMVYGSITMPKSHADDPVLVKSDGWPTYHLANVVDDHAMRITHVLRGEEWLPSLPLHLALYEALRCPPPAFAHLPLLMNKDGSKLSKRSGGHVNAQDYLAEGYEPEALLNFVALMGCNWHGREGDNEVMSLSEMVDGFSIANVSHARAKLHLDKLRFLNRQHMARKLERGGEAAAELLSRARQALAGRWPEAKELMTQSRVEQIVRAVMGRPDTVNEIADTASFLFEAPDWSTSEAAKLRGDPETYTPVLHTALDLVEVASEAQARDELWLTTALEDFALRLEAANGWQAGQGKQRVMRQIRHALTARSRGPSIGTVLVLMGPALARERLHAALDHFASEASTAALPEQ